VSKPIQRYESAEIEVTFEPGICIHAARCLAILPQVFDVRQRRWIAPENASADDVAATVRHCPSGALRYRRLDGGPAESPDTEPSVAPQPDGPLWVRGNIDLRDPDGNLVRHVTRAALCRCGGSANKPFCDNTHRTNGFHAP
jgi:uncharacterized Fe-S cluster protein YjdI